MYLPTFAHPHMHRDGNVTYVLCTPGCFITETDYDLEWHAGKGLLWKRHSDGSLGSADGDGSTGPGGCAMNDQHADDVVEYHDMFCEHNDGPYWDATPWPCNCEARRERLNDGRADAPQA